VGAAPSPATARNGAARHNITGKMYLVMPR